MSIIKPKPKFEREQIRIQMDSLILSEIKRYCEYVGFKKHDEFFEESASYILSKDKDFKEWKERNEESINAQ